MKQLKHRVLSMLVLAAILVPMVTLGVFAGSRQQPFNFTWSGATASKFSRGNKTDVGDSSAYYAQANITGGEFGGGTVSMWVERPDGTDVTADYYGIGSLGSRYFYYFDDAFRSTEVREEVPLDLSAHSNGMVQGFGGYWWP